MIFILPKVQTQPPKTPGLFLDVWSQIKLGYDTWVDTKYVLNAGVCTEFSVDDCVISSNEQSHVGL